MTTSSPTIPCSSCGTHITEERAAVADTLCEACGEPAGWKTWYLIGDSWATNALVWPDKESAEAEGLNRLMSWFVPIGSEARPTDDPPNRPNWDAYWKER